ncbi:uracil-DNA glycosylase [Candidatus Nitrosacidococcus tergens]|uniref:Type-4 uracil-DNA glycosylase n=1 Tax=Candidatus Nitrosacidococcus tergens TaxID=553981 RepID=A0A7G1QAN0_9GAMM|nr:uracil-DNA glycosylase [Candidatus Nitrosacidococcus tergens]CAB1276661.1 Phage SPO1 DNA polymerase-related protein [Candidatus Nitrosacidococcus tergens]
MKISHLHYLNAMGITLWQRREFLSTLKSERREIEKTSPSKIGWEELALKVSNCTACPLHKTRIQTVFGTGDKKAKWLIIGEAPGADEDKQGEPFVGRAGQLLNEMFKALGLQRSQIYITNILKCRPPNNRDPAPEEVVQCKSYLESQITLLNPLLILALGRVAAQNLLNTSETLGKLRNQVHRYPNIDIPLIITYHPAYLLRSPLKKADAWQDLQFALNTFKKLELDR